MPPKTLPDTDDDPAPGSPAAIAQGCTCDPVKNNQGQGFPHPKGRRFEPANDCLWHGPDAMFDLLLAQGGRPRRMDDPK